MNYSCGGDTMQRERERERECDSCRSAPAAVYCRADAAALCAACDADIHAANPISRRHHRVPVGSISNYGDEHIDWFGEEVVDEYLDHLDEFNSKQNMLNMDGTEQVIKNEAMGEHVFCYSAPHSNSVPLSSMEASHIVPDSTDDSNPYTQPPKGTMELFSSPLLHIPSQFYPMDREARVLRYREKKKNRKFEKTIRYALRKAYAEARPRIKGRFAKRTDLEELEVDRMFSDYAIPEDSYGVVPSF